MGTISQAGGWDLDSIDVVASGELTTGLTNPYTLDDFPKLKVFDG